MEREAPTPDRLTLADAERLGCVARGAELADYLSLVRLAEREMARAEAMLREARPGLPERGFLRPLHDAARDPRTGDLVVFGPGRELRTFRRTAGNCIVEDGEISPIVAHRPLSGEGRFCFVNLNLFPVLFPFAGGSADPSASARGLHFLFWPSNVHGDDWGTMTVPDVAAGLALVGEVERACLTARASGFPESGRGRAGARFGHFRVIRNSGALVGGSVEHPHLQMAHGGSQDGCLVRDRRFLAERGVGFGPWVLAHRAHVVRDYGDYVWLVPPFARRRLHCLIVPRQAGADHLHELDNAGRRALARALSDFTRAVPRAMERAGRPHAHNLVFHAGEIGGLYVEAIAPTQTVGGYEQAGMWINLQKPEDSARVFREALAATE